METTETARAAPVTLAAAFALSLSAVSSLTGWSERTVWRRLADGLLVRASETGAPVLIAWHSVARYCSVRFDDEGLLLLQAADAGNAMAQAELALHLLLDHGLPRLSWYWFEQAANRGNADAMYWLARGFLEGRPVAEDRNLGLMWLARAAAAGHAISQGLLDEWCRRFTAPASPRCIA